MPIYARSYQRLERQRTPRSRRALALAREAVKRHLKRRSFLALLALGWIPAIVRAVQIYVTHQFPQARDFVSLDASTWLDFLSQQVFYLPVVLVSLYVGAGAISTDLASGAYVLYISKPISRLEYVVGRGLPVMAAIGVVTLLPGLALLMLEVSIASDLGVLREAPWLPVSIVAYSSWLALYFTVVVLSISSLSRSRLLSGVGFAALVLGTEIVLNGALARIGVHRAVTRLGVMSAAIDSGNGFFGEGPAGAAMLVMTTTMVAGAFVLRKRLGTADVVQ